MDSSVLSTDNLFFNKMMKIQTYDQMKENPTETWRLPQSNPTSGLCLCKRQK